MTRPEHASEPAFEAAGLLGGWTGRSGRPGCSCSGGCLRKARRSSSSGGRSRNDKFVGDGLLAVFGTPRRQDDHADKALAAALEIEPAVEREFPGELAIGIGLVSGTVVAGNVGAGRLEFTVIGDAVNVAAAWSPRRIRPAARSWSQSGPPICCANSPSASTSVPTCPEGQAAPVALYAAEKKTVRCPPVNQRLRSSLDTSVRPRIVTSPMPGSGRNPQGSSEERRDRVCG